MQSVESAQAVVAFADHITTVLTIEDLWVISQALFDIGLPVGWPLLTTRFLHGRHPARQSEP